MWLHLSVVSLVCSSALGLALPPSTKTCVVPHDVHGADDSPGFASVLANCSSNSTIVFSKGTTYNILTPVVAPALSNVVIEILGNLNLERNVTSVQTIVNASSFSGYWFSFKKGVNIRIQGSIDPNWGWVDSFGQQWWDAGNQVSRPHGWTIGASNVVLFGLKIRNPIAWNFSLGGSNILVDSIIIQAKSNSSAFPFNTDGFDVGGTNVTVRSSHVVNGDDCITINNGGANIYSADMYCEGGHGASIGSLGSKGSVASVHNISFERFTFVNSLYGARFKSWSGGNGIAQNVTYKDFALSNVTFPIYITQNYYDQGTGSKPNGTSANNTHIDNFSYSNFFGTIDTNHPGDGSCVSDPCWYYVANATGTESVIFDFAAGTATNIHTENIWVLPQNGRRETVLCNPATLAAGDDVGFVCHNGPYIPA